MHDRFTIKIAGPAGGGIKSSGLIICKAAKRAGFYTFGYTEYPSLIKGGQNVFQVEVSDKPIGSITKDTDVLLPLDQASVDLHLDEFDQDSGILILDKSLNLSEEQQARINELKLKVFEIPLVDLAMGVGGSAIMKNTVALGAVWKTLGLEVTVLQDVVAEIFKRKGEEIVKQNRDSIQAGFDAVNEEFKSFTERFKPNEQVKDHYILGGNESLSLGAIACGVKIYSSYPMTPASSILTSLAAWSQKSGMLVKQAEDEITAINMCIGANFAGTRSLCGTSGGGFDLMSEGISLAGMTETPLVAVLAQRHGAATGAPTWTGQGDLNMAINTGHSEFPRCVISCSDAEDVFYLMGDAFNIAEKFQLPVIFLTEKTIAESFYTVADLDQDKITIDRGEIVEQDSLDGAELRYKITESGISPRWFPGQKGTNEKSRINSTFVANSDSNTEKGYSTEDDKEIKKQIEKQMRKIEALRAYLPEPKSSGDENPDIIFITWGSNRTILEDAARILREKGKKIQIINFTYLWPFKTETLETLKGLEDKVYVVEQNYTGQLAKLIQNETGLKFKKINRYDSKPFYVEDILDVIPA